MSKKQMPLILALLISATVSLYAQPTHCITFDELEVGLTLAGESDVFHNTPFYSDDIAVLSLDTFLQANGFELPFGNINVQDYPEIPMEAPFLFINYKNVKVDFTQNPNYSGAEVVCFDYVPSGHEVNLAINGELGVFDNFTQTIDEFPGFDITVSPNNNLNQPGTVCIFGPIESIAVGGVEFSLDNICYTPTPSFNCGFTDVVAEAYCAENNEVLNLELDFNPLNVSNDFFDLFVDGEFHSFHAFESLPLNLENIAIVGEQELVTLQICENDNPDCCYTLDIEVPQACSCELSNMVVGQYPCDTNVNNYLLYLDFNYNELAGESFNLQGNGNFYGTFNYADLPILELEVEGAPGDILEFVAIDLATDLCETFTTFTLQECQEVCESFAATYTSDGCASIGHLALDIVLSVPPVGQEITIEASNGNYSLDLVYDSYESLSITWPVEALGENLLITDHLTGCQTSLFIANTSPDLCSECAITEVNITATDCNPNNVFGITIDFDYSWPEGEFFIQAQEDMVFGPYALDEFPVTLSPFIGEPGQSISYPVTIYEASEACEYNTVFTHACGGCQLDITSFESFCAPNSSNLVFEVAIESNLPEGVFTAVLGGVQTASIFYEESNVAQFYFPLEQQVNLPNPIWVEVFGENNNCIAEAFLEWEPCTYNCEQFGVEEYAIVCENADQVAVTLFFSVPPSGQEMIAIAEGQNVGVDFIYDSNPVTILLPAFLEPGPLFIIDQSTDCQTQVDYNPPPDDCEDCDIFDVIIEGTDCAPNGQYNLVVYFESNLANGLFDVWNQTTGDRDTISLDQVPFTMPPIFFEEVQTSVFRIAALGQQGCVEELVFEQECEFSCNFSEILIEGTECDANGDYFLEIYFESNYNGLFEVTNQATGQSEVVSQEGLPLTMGPINFGQIQTSVILIEAIGVPCADEALYVHECQPLDECNFSNIFAEPYACDGDEFLVDIAFDNGFGGPLGFYIFGDGMIFGPYAYGETFYTFGPLDGTEEEHTILILDIADPACFGTYDFSFTCGDECMIQEVIATPTDCDGEVFGVFLDVIGDNLGETFTVVGNGNNYGTFSYEDTPIFLGPFPGDNETAYEFGVIDLQNADCTNWTEIEPVNCLPCSIENLTYEVSCMEDFYELTIDFDYENPESDFFRLQIGGDTYESFAYESLPLTLDMPLEWNGNTLHVEDAAFEACGQTVDFEMNCCFIGFDYENVSASDCQDDGTFYIEIGESYGYALSDNLVVTYAPAGSSIVETVVIPYSQLPAQVGPVEGNGNTPYFVVLSDELNDCSTSLTIEPVYCDDLGCVEFEDISGIFGPVTNYESGQSIGTENGVNITFEEYSLTACECNLFAIDQSALNGIDFGSGQILSPQSAGVGFSFANAQPFTSFSIDYYFGGGEMSMSVNGGDLVTVDNPLDFPTNLAPGVVLEVFPSNNTASQGSMIFSGDIQAVNFYSSNVSAFDNLCMDTEFDPVSSCLELPFSNDFIVLAEAGSDDEIIFEDDVFTIASEGFYEAGFVYHGSIMTQPFDQGCSPSNIDIRTQARNLNISFPETGDNGTVFFSFGQENDSINFRVNNEVIGEYVTVFDIPANPAPGVTVTVEGDPTTGFGSVTIHGNINFLTIGGFDLCIWDLCIEQDENVWPGDTNTDNLAGHFDLLNIGLAYGFNGPARENTGDEWAAFIAEDWTNNFANGTNYKHADANGDGTVDVEDRSVIALNYNLTHGTVDEFEPLPATEIDPPVFVDLSGTEEVPNGAVFEIPIVVGSVAQEVQDIYGIAFTVNLDPGAIDLSSIEIVYPTSWMGEPDINMITIHELSPDGLLEVALVRTDHNNVSGFGPVVFIRGIIDDLAGLHVADIGMEKVHALNHDEIQIPLRPNGGTIQITRSQDILDRQMLKATFRAFPNPTTGTIYFSNIYDYPPERIDIITVSGQVVRSMENPGREVSLHRLPAGVYFCKIHLHGHIFTERIVKIEP